MTTTSRTLARAATIMLATVAMLVAAVPTASAASSKPVPGGNLVIVGTDPSSFNPLAMGTLSGVGAALSSVYGTLTLENKKTGAIEGAMLKSFVQSPDATVYTLNLRPGVKFSDGTPFDSSAIKFAFDFAGNPANRSGAVGIANEVASWDVSDPLVAKATLKAPDAAWGVNMNVQISMIPSPTAVQKYGADYGTSADKVVGAGPFTLASWTRGSQIVFNRNPNYWDKPKPYLDSVTIKYIPDTTTAYNTVATGGADLMQSPTQAIQDQAKAAGMRIEPYFLNTVPFRSNYIFNLQRAPFNDILARQAVATALDPKKISAALGQPIIDSIFDHDGFYYDKAGTLLKFDPKKAQDLINQWSAKNGGATLEFTVPQIPGVAGLFGNGEAVQAAMTGYDKLKVNVTNVPAASAVSLATSGNFDLFPNLLGGADPDIAVHTLLQTGAGRNYGKYSNKEMDDAIKAGVSTTELPARKKAYATVQKLIIQDLPIWIIPAAPFVTNHFLISNKNVQNFVASAWAGPLVADIWLKKKK